MRADRPSDTAIYVAMGRALAHAQRVAHAFNDPVAQELLPDDCRAAVERLGRRERPRSAREAALYAVAYGTSRLMAPRTVVIDEGLREMPAGHQLVIVGAGLDARAYRMRELSESVVFEVDHPASQAYKRQKAQGLTPLARELRYVPVDFERERLGDALERAGHSPALPTAWVFEGVISYLTPRAVEEAIEEMAARSAPGSRLLATYNAQRLSRRVFSGATARLGEPQRAWFSPEAMRRLLEQRSFLVRSDTDGLERARRCGVEPSLLEHVWMRFHHVVIAERA